MDGAEQTSDSPRGIGDLERLGYEVVRLVEPAVVAALVERLDQLGPAPDDPRHGSFHGGTSTDPSWRLAVREAAEPLVAAAVALPPGHRVLDVALDTAWPGLASHDAPQRNHGVQTMRVPLPTDGPGRDGVDGGDGVVAGSHLVAPGATDLPAPVATEIRQRLSQRPPVAPGEALVLDGEVISWAPSNRTDRPRRTLVLAVEPVDAVPPEAAAPPGPVATSITVADLEDGLRRAGRPVPPPPPLRHRPPRPRRVPARSPGVLADATADRRLGRDGFVVLPGFLTRAAAHGLRAAYGDLHGWEGEDFVVDFWNSDAGYRRRASEAIGRVVDDQVAHWFPGHRPLSRSFLVKWPGGGEDRFPQAPHLDWMYTDEADGVRSWTIWIALDDVTERQGALRLARGSHRLDPGIQGTDLKTPWLEHRQTWERRLVAVPVRAGDAIVSDANLVHSSFPNLTDQPRVAVAVAVCPVDATLVHHRRVDDTTAARFEVDDDFYLDQPIDELVELGLDRAPSALVPIGERPRSALRLAWDLDRQPLSLLDHLHRARRALSRRVLSRSTGDHAG